MAKMEKVERMDLSVDLNGDSFGMYFNKYTSELIVECTWKDADVLKTVVMHIKNNGQQYLIDKLREAAADIIEYNEE